MRRVALVAAVALLAAGLAGCMSSEPAPPTDEALEWRFTDTEGQVHDHEAAAGSPTVIFFMATWCGSCEKKADDMRAVHEAYDEEGVDVYSLSVDPRETPEDLEQWKASHDQPWPHGVDEDLNVSQTFDVEQTSNVVVLDGQNRIVQHWGYGEANEEAMRSVIDELLA